MGDATVVAAQAQEEAKPFLLTLRSPMVILNYTPGALDRAVHVQRRLELVAVDFSKWAKASLQMRVFILSRQEWDQFGFILPYGLPGRIQGTTLAIPAIGDSGTIELWTGIRGIPPMPLAGIPMKGTAEEASTLAMTDLLMEVEAARIMLASSGIRGEVTWLHQVLAHLVARAAFETYEAARMGEITAFFDSLGAGIDPPLSMDQYTQGLGLDSYLWFESRFQDGARTVLESTKKNEAKVVVKIARENGGVLTESAFLDLYPMMRGWLNETFAPSMGPIEVPGS